MADNLGIGIELLESVFLNTRLFGLYIIIPITILLAINVLITRKKSDWKVLTLPIIVGLGLCNVRFSPLIYGIAIVMFVFEGLSKKVLTGSISAIGGFASDISKGKYTFGKEALNLRRQESAIFKGKSQLERYKRSSELQDSILNLAKMSKFPKHSLRRDDESHADYIMRLRKGRKVDEEIVSQKDVNKAIREQRAREKEKLKGLKKKEKMEIAKQERFDKETKRKEKLALKRRKEFEKAQDRALFERRQESIRFADQSFEDKILAKEIWDSKQNELAEIRRKRERGKLKRYLD